MISLFRDQDDSQGGNYTFQDYCGQLAIKTFIRPLPKEVLKHKSLNTRLLLQLDSQQSLVLPLLNWHHYPCCLTLNARSDEPEICEVVSAWPHWRTKAIMRIIQARAWLCLSSIITWKACFSEYLQRHIQTKTILFSGWLPQSFGPVTLAPVEKWYSSCSGPEPVESINKASRSGPVMGPTVHSRKKGGKSLQHGPLSLSSPFALLSALWTEFRQDKLAWAGPCPSLIPFLG